MLRSPSSCAHLGNLHRNPFSTQEITKRETRNEESQRTREKKTTTHIEKRQKECLNNALEIDNAMCVHINTRSVGTIPVKTLTNHIYAENVKQSAKSLK